MSHLPGSSLSIISNLELEGLKGEMTVAGCILIDKLLRLKRINKGRHDALPPLYGNIPGKTH